MQMLRLMPFVLFACSFVGAQQDSPSPAVAPGTEFPVEVSHTISANKAHVGEVLEFTTLEGVLAGHQLVIPANAKIFGHVVEVRPPGSGPAELRFTIDQVRWKNNVAPLGAVISGVGRRRFESSGYSMLQPTFLEGTSITIRAVPTPMVSLSNSHNVVLRSGTLLILKQVTAPAVIAEQ